MKICSAIPVVSNVHTVWALPVCLPQSYGIKRRICRGFGQKSSRRTLLGNYPKPEDTYQMLDFSYVVRFLGIIFLREIGKNRVVFTSIKNNQLSINSELKKFRKFANFKIFKKIKSI